MKENNNEKYEITLPAGDHASKGGQAGRPFTTILRFFSSMWKKSIMNMHNNISYWHLENSKWLSSAILDLVN